MNRRALGWTWPVVVAVLATAALACNVGSVAPEITPGATAQATERATHTPGERAMRPAGTYFCFGHEGGTLASAAILTLYSDGTYLDAPPPVLSRPGRRGRWSFDPSSNTVTFPDDSLFAAAEYDPSIRHLQLDFLPEMTRVHAENGTMSYTWAPDMAP